jgi:hypothetical protein
LRAEALQVTSAKAALAAAAGAQARIKSKSMNLMIHPKGVSVSCLMHLKFYLRQSGFYPR